MNVYIVFVVADTHFRPQDIIAVCKTRKQAENKVLEFMGMRPVGIADWEEHEVQE